MLLGDVIARLGDGTTVHEALAAPDSQGLLAAPRDAAAADGLSIDTWAREAVGRFSVYADDEQWLGLLAACRNAPDPGAAALHYMLKAAFK
jgi:hypothetical protein